MYSDYLGRDDSCIVMRMRASINGIIANPGDCFHYERGKSISLTAAAGDVDTMGLQRCQPTQSLSHAFLEGSIE